MAHHNQFSIFDKHLHLVSKEDFMARVVKMEDSECWDLKNRRPARGYRHYWMKSLGVSILAHRLSFFIHYGSIDSTLVIDHKCRNRFCVNPAHLRNVPQKLNATENSSGVTAINKAKTHCKRGHEFTPENTQIKKKGKRCATCHREGETLRRKRMEAEKHGA